MCTRDVHWQSGDLRQDCNARCIATGDSIFPPILCLGLQATGMGLFFAFPARYLLVVEDNAAPITLGAVLSALCLALFLCACFTDPGVLPPAEVAPYLIHESRPPRTQNILTSQGKCTLKYCDVCNIYRPPRAEHCPTCKNCVLKFDHRTFLLFVRIKIDIACWANKSIRLSMDRKLCGWKEL